MPGGRPKNDWTATRERKLARLYTLSDLDIEEIRKLLNAKGFDPSSSDVQKKLRALLPKDYAKEHRRFRPSSLDNARLRFDRMRQCKDNRVQKYGRSRRQARVDGDDSTHSEPAASNADVVQGRFSASCDYPASPVRVPVPEQYLSMELLDLNATAHPFEPWDAAWIAEDGLLAAADSHAEDSKLEVNTRSNITSSACHESIPNQRHLSDDEYLTLGTQMDPLIRYITSAEAHEGRALGLSGRSSMVLAVEEPQWNSLLPNRSSADAIDQGPNAPSDAVSICSLGRRLTKRYSPSYIEHIDSVLRFSSTGSWRSSLLSVASFASSRKSGKSSIDQRQSSPEDRASTTSALLPSVPRKVVTRLTRGEQRVWRDLVDESKVAHSVPLLRTSRLTSLITRPCCGLMEDSVQLTDLQCNECGFSPAHYFARLCSAELNLSLILTHGINRMDLFDNTPLHYAAASGNATASVINFLINNGANIRARNTSGETFLHVLHQKQLGCIENYCEILRLLKELNFPFSHRDFHGRTIAHRLFETVEPSEIPGEALREIFSILNPDINALDNLGHKFHQGIMDDFTISEARLARKEQLRVLLNQYHNPSHVGIDFRIMYSSMLRAGDLWVSWVAETGYINWVDIHGDTPLITLVKEWPDGNDERELKDIIKNLISLGAEVHMRDRRGDSALAVAVRRGFRPAATALLTFGANPNTRSYQGTGILSQATQHLQRAEHEKNGRRYAMILSCMTLLSDHGAMEKPTPYHEWMSPTTTLAIAKKSTAVL